MQPQQDDVLEGRMSPGGRPIRVRRPLRRPPEWMVRRHQVDRVIDQLADGAKRAVRRWLVPRPRPV